jgi:serine protease Do
MNSRLGRATARRLLFSFAILTTLTAGILIGSVVSHGVKAKEQVSSSDATPLKVPSPQVLSNTFSTIAKQVEPAVVNINTESLPKQTMRHRGQGGVQQSPDDSGGDDQDQGQGQGDNSMQDFFNRFFGGQMPDGMAPEQGPRMALGSGFIVDSKGYIITNNHVVDKADRITVKLSTDPEGDPGRPAKVVGVDKSTDIAVLKIETKEPLPTVKLGNSDSMQIGDWVLAVGSPFGLQETVTAGIVSSKDRDIGQGVASQFQRFIQTDAAINPGNSGGPLVNMSGEVIGVNTAIYTQSQGYQGVGFAMPSNTVADVYNQLVGPNHKVTRGWIGIAFQAAMSSATARMYGFKNGVLVSSVDPGGPADKAGLRSEDVITTVDGRPVKGGDDLVADISSRHPGASLKIGYLRGGKQENTILVVGDRDKGLAARSSTGPGSANDENTPEDNGASTKIGVSIRNVPANVASKMGIHGGVQIMSVIPGSFADEIGLAQGSVVTEINKKPVNSDQDFKNIVSGLKSGDDVVFVLRDPRDTTGGAGFRGGTLP